ncbi:vacuolar ATPase assembly integral membrane protein vma21, partial [Ascosphaera pollenicola]
MHILVTNDDGPPSQQSSPYVHSLIHNLQAAGHTVSVVLPNRQRSWIGKAHLAGVTVKPTYFRPGTLHKDDGTVHELPLKEEEEEEEEKEEGNSQDEWILLDSTPATCVQIGLNYYFKDRGPIDLVLSGPNYGRNTTTVFALSSGTLGGALEAAVCGKRAIALSYAFSSRDHDPIVIAEASRHSVKLVEHLYSNWNDGVDVYSVNVPLEPGISTQKILYTNMLKNAWKTGSTFQAVDAESMEEGASSTEHETRVVGEVESATGERPQFKGHKHQYFKWAPTFGDVFKSVEDSEPGNDGWAVKTGYTSVTPLQANFAHVPKIEGEIQLSPDPIYALIDYDDAYVHPLILQALSNQIPHHLITYISSLDELPKRSAPVLQWRIYENLDFEHALIHATTSLVNAYVIRKALIRKHYLSQTVETWITKRPSTALVRHVKPTCNFELDYAEFLDDALIDCYELVESFQSNEGKEARDREWWILKPGMSDRGQGISTLDQCVLDINKYIAQQEDVARRLLEANTDDDDGDGHDAEHGHSGGPATSLSAPFSPQPPPRSPLRSPQLPLVKDTQTDPHTPPPLKLTTDTSGMHSIPEPTVSLATPTSGTPHDDEHGEHSPYAMSLAAQQNAQLENEIMLSLTPKQGMTPVSGRSNSNASSVSSLRIAAGVEPSSSPNWRLASSAENVDESADEKAAGERPTLSPVHEHEQEPASTAQGSQSTAAPPATTAADASQPKTYSTILSSARIWGGNRQSQVPKAQTSQSPIAEVEEAVPQPQQQPSPTMLTSPTHDAAGKRRSLILTELPDGLGYVEKVRPQLSHKFSWEMDDSYVVPEEPPPAPASLPMQPQLPQQTELTTPAEHAPTTQPQTLFDNLEASTLATLSSVHSDSPQSIGPLQTSALPPGSRESDTGNGAALTTTITHISQELPHRPASPQGQGPGHLRQRPSGQLLASLNTTNLSRTSTVKSTAHSVDEST